MQRSRVPGRSGFTDVNSSVSSAGSIGDSFGPQPYNRLSPGRRSPPEETVVRTTGTVMRYHRRDLPWGIRIIRKISNCCGIRISQEKRDLWYQISVLFITFLSYTTYHLSRKPISIVKNVLNQNCSLVARPPDLVTNSSTWCDWAPFDSPDSETLLGTLDSAFLFAYAFGMFFSGFIAERCNLRYFLSLGMLLSGLFTYLFGLAYSRGIHNIYYFIFAQAMSGLFQTTGWPGVVTVVGNWFGKGKRGLIFGLWNSHTSLGNILGSVIAGAFVEYNWGLSFIVPGAIIGLSGFIVFLFLVPKPQHVGCTVPDHHGSGEHTHVTPENARPSGPRHPGTVNTSPSSNLSPRRTYGAVGSDSDESLDGSSESNYHIRDETPLLSSYLPYDHAGDELPQVPSEEVKIKAVGFVAALKIPGVIEYSLCLFFAKLVSYTFLYWLPRYIGNSTTFSAQQSANLSTLFDFGGILGGIVAGAIADISGMNASCCAGMLGIAIPMLMVYQSYGSESLWANIVLLVIVGLLVNGPYCLITTSISTELGTHPCLMGNARALATVVAIIDGTGSIGAAIGPLLAGPLSDLGWKYVFYMLMISDILALLLLSRLVSHEIKRLFTTEPSRPTASYRNGGS